MAVIDAFRRPDPERVVREHGPEVLRLLRRVLGPGQEVEDVAQAVFIEVLRALPRFRGKAKLKTFIHRITLNVAYQELRARYRHRRVWADTVLEEEKVPAGSDLESEVCGRRQVELLYEALGDLSPKKRLAVILHDLEGRSLREIAEDLGRPLPTIASQVRAGRSELAEWFARREAHVAARREKR
ncbi:MAG: RNA polymerase sigma factor [Myxococcota bacterium]